MRLAELVQLRINAAEQNNVPSTPKKVSKVDAGYVHREGTEYRCEDCWKFIPPTNQCAEYGLKDTARPKGTCTEWSFGTPVPGLKPNGSLSPQTTAYTELFNGTKCMRCKFFDPEGYCSRVDEKSPGDDPNKIDPGACCRFQTAKVAT